MNLPLLALLALYLLLLFAGLAFRVPESLELAEPTAAHQSEVDLFLALPSAVIAPQVLPLPLAVYGSP
jgi:hypothetical protein